MKNKEINKERLKPISLYPLKPEKALSLVMQVNLGKISISSKPCRVCHAIKLLTEFSKDSQLKSGISNRCKACEKERNKKRSFNPREIKEGSWQYVTKRLSFSVQEEFKSLYGNSDVRVKGRLVMKKGNIIDKEWYEKKLSQLKRYV